MSTIHKPPLTRKDRAGLVIMLGLILLIPLLTAGYMGYDWFVGDPGGGTPVAPTLEAATQNQVVYRIDAAQSEVRYNVDEVFLRDNTLASPVGVTKGVAGDVLIDFADPAQSQVGTIVINVEQFRTDRSLRDGAIRREFLESSTYPEARFVTTALVNFPANPQEGVPFSFQIVGDLTIKESTAPATWEITLTLQGEVLTGQAKTTILMSSFGVGPISVAGFVQTEDEVRLEFDFVALRVAAAPATPEITPGS